MKPIIKAATKVTQEILNFVLPPRCISCGTLVDEHGKTCPECWKGISFIGKHKCNICGLPFEFDVGTSIACKYCQADKPKFKKALAVCKYEGNARKIAVRFKFGDSTHLAPYIANLMSSAGEEVIGKAEIVAPVPLHFKRKLKRKYNQAALLAKHISTTHELGYQPFLLRRIKPTKQQTTLNKKQRQENVTEAFQVTNKDIVGKNILLIDDVMTTGSTMNACAIALKKAGAKNIYGLVFARVVTA